MYQSGTSPALSQRMSLKICRSSGSFPSKPRAVTLSGITAADQLTMACPPPISLGRMLRGSRLTPSSPSQTLPLESMTSRPPILILSGSSKSWAAVCVVASRPSENKSEKTARLRIETLLVLGEMPETGKQLLMEYKFQPTRGALRSMGGSFETFSIVTAKNGVTPIRVGITPSLSVAALLAASR